MLVGCGGPTDGRGTPWNPGQDGGETEIDVDPHGTTSGGSPQESTGGMEACEPGESGDCLCDDGLHLGRQTCDDDGTWGECVCDGDETSTTGDPGDGDGGDESTGGAAAGEVCYLGADESYTTCFELYHPDAPPDGYDYPAPLNGDANYREPIAYLDLEAIDPDVYLAPNFRIGELAQLSKGRWAVIQPHAVERLQDLRDAVGAISVNSGFRSPGYNAGIAGSATHSRHMYGDGFDLDPVSATLDTLEAECVDIGGMLVEYSSHVHCDFRFDPVAEEFFGEP